MRWFSLGILFVSAAAFGLAAPGCGPGRPDYPLIDAGWGETTSSSSGGSCASALMPCEGEGACCAGLTCQGSVCQCPFGQSLCGDTCVDTSSSPLHCGQCNNACGDTCCNGTCVDLKNDPGNCGACKHTCSGEICDNGACPCGTDADCGGVGGAGRCCLNDQSSHYGRCQDITDPCSCGEACFPAEGKSHCGPAHEGGLVCCVSPGAGGQCVSGSPMSDPSPCPSGTVLTTCSY